MTRVDPETVLCGRMFVDGELRYTEVGIADGKIVSVGRLVSGGEERIDLGTSMTVLPGFMDPHVHLRDPGMTSKEDFSTGTMSAVCGGVTCVLDMPNTKPPVTDLQTLMDKKRTVRGRSYADYGLFAALTPNCPAALLAPHVPAFKLFMGSTTGNILLNDDEEIAPVMEEIAGTGKVVSVHAEDDDFIVHGEEERCCQDHLRNRPVEAEFSALRRLAQYKDTNRINICHCTNAEQVRMASSLGFTTEVTMHHLMFDALRNTSAIYKTNPPIRDKATKDALFQCLLRGEITMFGTDHAPHTLEEKSRDFDSAPGGIPGVETTMPMVMEMVRAGTLGMCQAVRMGAENPGSVFSVPKGRIAVGYDADFSIFDMRKVSEIDQKRLHSKAGFSPYHGMRAVFPDTVIIRGQVQVKEGELCGEPLGKDVCG
ncbi:dihydroorotase family protein [Methanomethylophilus alvi]|uniref:dihydroorotase family protein n=1 Tax=Methanomethylophilus alvi TaxID=1291540 RepID=UPI0037DCB69B